MQWSEIRTTHPHKWILVEAVKAHSEGGKRVLEQLTVINSYIDSLEAMNQYKEMHKQFPEREFYVLHTDKEIVDISEKRWLGIRGIQ